jgi:hypothetical protein
MRALTFRGFLGQYVSALSLSGSKKLYKLAAEAAVNNPRLKEPLFLYALFSDKADYLLAATKSPSIAREYRELLTRFDKASMEAALKSDDPVLRAEYRKVYTSYLAVRDKKKNEHHTKTLMHSKIVRLQKEKGVSSYRICKDLELNSGNLGAYLKNGDCSKVSLDTARKAINYLEGFPGGPTHGLNE